MTTNADRTIAAVPIRLKRVAASFALKKALYVAQAMFVPRAQLAMSMGARIAASGTS